MQIGAAGAIADAGGVMDLAIGAKHVFVMMYHQIRASNSKIVANCTYPLSGASRVSRVCTDLVAL